MAKSAPLRILLTGATRGLGRALLDRFAALGHVVLGCGRSQTHVEQLRQQFGPPHHFRVVNVAAARQVQAWAEEVLPHGAPDLLLNNAALMNEPAKLWEVPAEEFDRLIDVNVKGVVNVLRSFLPAMIARKKGVIVNFSSGWGRSTSPEVAPYCCSKWAIEGLTQAMAQELPSGLAAVALQPGDHRHRHAAHLLGRGGPPVSFAGAVERVSGALPPGAGAEAQRRQSDGAAVAASIQPVAADPLGPGVSVGGRVNYRA